MSKSPAGSNKIAETVLFKGKTFVELLSCTIDEAFDVFTAIHKVARLLATVKELGLGYVSLSQKGHTLSKGELQRIFLAKRLSIGNITNSLILLDEPARGLHPSEELELLLVLRKLIDKGNTIIAIEHKECFSSGADYLIELGPGAGDKGGRIIS